MSQIKMIFRKSVAFFTAVLFLFMPITPSVAALCSGASYTQDALLQDVPEIPHSSMNGADYECGHSMGHQTGQETGHHDNHKCEHSGGDVCRHATKGYSITSCSVSGESLVPVLITVPDLIPASRPELISAEIVVSIKNILTAVSVGSSQTVYRPPIV